MALELFFLFSCNVVVTLVSVTPYDLHMVKRWSVLHPDSVWLFSSGVAIARIQFSMLNTQYSAPALYGKQRESTHALPLKVFLKLIAVICSCEQPLTFSSGILGILPEIKDEMSSTNLQTKMSVPIALKLTRWWTPNGAWKKKLAHSLPVLLVPLADFLIHNYFIFDNSLVCPTMPVRLHVH